MKNEKRKQIILIVLAFVFIGIGVFNFRLGNSDSIEVSASDSRNEFNLGDVQLVNSDVSNENEIKDKNNDTENNEYLAEIVSNDELENMKLKETTNDIKEQNNASNQNENIENNKETYFIETRLQRDTMYSEMIETYQKMLESAEIHENQKAIATQEISNITNRKNGIMISENLIKNKGFEEVVILVNNGSASVIVKSSLLNQEQIAKIQNIVSRELNIEVQNINISNK